MESPSLNTGHGWVRPLPWGTVARCGGPGVCASCRGELESLTEAVRELFYWQVSDATPWFHYLLYDLIGHSDTGNRARISFGFPWEVEAFKQWESAPDETEFFKKFGFDRSTFLSTKRAKQASQEK